ncbi:MAG: hypothetical protein DHS20C14_21920 [Phycisphaeraceae bacterium]|nr:MAG: hypothetical protein DHS20C14_21920 [Phycisphaeraceae bacterium]
MSMTAILMATALVGTGPYAVTNVRPMADIVEIRPQMMDTSDVRADQVRDVHASATVVGELDAEGNVAWIPTRSNQRARYGADDSAPSLIYVRVFDGVFAIDPFEPLPQTGEYSELYAPVDITTARQLFNGSSLETDRALFDRRRIERTEELFRALERARQGWLRSNGYLGTRTFTNPNAGAGDAEVRATPEPAGWFRKPAELPLGKPREAVQGEPLEPAQAESIASNILDGATRISTPPGMSAASAQRLVAHAEPEASESDELASNE